MKIFGAKNQPECDQCSDTIETSTDQCDQGGFESNVDDSYESPSTEEIGEIEMIDIINDPDKTTYKKSKTQKELRSIFSKKHTDSILNDEKFFHQNKRIVLYKTEMCRGFSEVGYCKYGDRCQFCHSPEELRIVKRHPKYKTEICKTFWSEGSCPYGSRCCFIHLEKKQKHVFKTNQIEVPTISIRYQLCVTGRILQTNTSTSEKQKMPKHAEKRLFPKKSLEKIQELANDLCLPIIVSQSSIRNEGDILDLIFPYTSDVMRAARALEADKILDFTNSSDSVDSSKKYNGIFSSLRSIDDVQVERVDTWSKNYIRKWNDNPVFYIFDNKYSKLYC